MSSAPNVASSRTGTRSAAVLKNSLGRKIAQASHAFRIRVDDALRDRGISAAQFALLDRLHAAGRPLSGREIADLIALRPQSVAEMLGPLVQLGLISRTPHPSHGRIIESTLTRKGVVLLTACAKVVEEVERSMIACLSKDEIAACGEMLSRMTGALREGRLSEDLVSAELD